MYDTLCWLTLWLLSMSDGAPGQSTGVPYFYISKWEISAQDLAQDNKASITMSLAQGSYCSTQATVRYHASRPGLRQKGGKVFYSCSLRDN